MNFAEIKKKTEAFALTIIGMKIDDVERAAKVQKIMIIRPGVATTMDLRVDRIFVQLDNDSQVTSTRIS